MQAVSEFRRKIESDPDAFSRIVWGRTRWSRQHEIRDSIWNRRWTHVQSANSIGKTNELAATAIEWLVRNKGGRVLITGPTHDAAKFGLFASIRSMVHEAERKGVVFGPPIGEEYWRLGEEWDMRVASVDNISAIQGARGKRCLILIDEAQGLHDPKLLDAIESLMTASGSRMVASGNPLAPTGPFYDHLENPDWNVIAISGFEHPNVVLNEEVIPGAITNLWIEERRRKWREGSIEWTARVLGQFPKQGEDQLIGLDDLEACAEITPKIDEDPRSGLDVALDGDQSVQATYDRTRTLRHVDAWRDRDTMATVGRALANARRANANIRVDCIGIGAGVGDRLREQGHRVDMVNFSEEPQRDYDAISPETLFANRRAELWYRMRAMLRAREISIPKEHREVWADLLAPRYGYDSAGRIKIESKEAIKKRIGRSPDHGDATVIALSNMASGRPLVEIWN